MFGLKDTHIKLIQSVFGNYSSVDKTVIYGSRAKGNYSIGSDIDLTMKGDDLNLSTLLKIENNIEPYQL